MYLTKGIQWNQINFNRDFHGLINFCLETFIDAYVMKFLAPAVTKPSYCLLWREGIQSRIGCMCATFSLFSNVFLKLPPWIGATSFLLHVFACPRYLSFQNKKASSRRKIVDVHNINFYFLYMTTFTTNEICGEYDCISLSHLTSC